MTECERIIQNGIVSKSFLDEEVKCDFLVTEKLKKIQAIELDLLLEFDRVCKKHNLKYFLYGGTLLGAVRHKGFIPWDDDTDVIMLREDHDKLMKLADEFNEPYFLQTPYTDKGCYFSFAKLRNSRTTAISVDFKYEKFNQGIYLDVFPLDNCLMEDAEDRYNRIHELIMDNSTYMRMSDPNPSPENKQRIQKHSGRNPMDVYEEIIKIATQYKDLQTEFVNKSTITGGGVRKTIYKRSSFDDVCYMNFEGYELPVPIGYKNLLETQYGDYQKLPPVDKRGTQHSKIIFEPDISYKFFLPEYLRSLESKLC